MNNKKGSLNLSIQAIVILVMAMAVLGLGLGFIRTLMGQGQDQFKTAIDNAALENPATADNPITVDTNVGVKAGGTAKFNIGFYNAGSIAPTGGFIPTLNGCGDGYTIMTGGQTVTIGEARGYKALLTAPSTEQGATAGSTKVCTVEFADIDGLVVASKQFYINIIA